MMSSGIKGYFEAIFSADENRGWHSKLTELQGYGYAICAALFFCFPAIVRTFFFLLPDTNILSDGAIRIFFVPVFSIGFFYVVAGRTGNRPHSLASGLNRPFLVALPACILYFTGDIDMGLMLIMLLYDGAFGVLTLVLSALYGIEKPFHK